MKSPSPEAAILSVSPNRFVVVHYHIFKNAGSTVEYALRRMFGEQFATLHGPDANSTLHGQDVASFLLCHPEIIAISSHHLKYPKPVVPGVIVFDLCVVREHVLANAGAYTRPPNSGDLAAALKVAREMSVIGVVELFDESLVTAEYFLRPAFPGIRFEYVSQNISPGAGFQFREEIGDAIYQQLQEMNRLDAELVTCACGEVRRRFRLIPDSPAKLAAFRKRCAALDRTS